MIFGILKKWLIWSFVIQSIVDVIFGGHIHMITMVTELVSTRQISVTVICIYNEVVDLFFL